MADPITIRGSCACNSITWTTTRPMTTPLQMTNCHCIQCRKVSGSTHISFISLPKASVAWSQTPSIYSHTDFAERGFCSKCGSSLYMLYHFMPDETFICAGTADWWQGKEENGGRGQLASVIQEMWLEESAAWKLADDREVLTRGSSSLDHKIELWNRSKKGT